MGDEHSNASEATQNTARPESSRRDPVQTQIDIEKWLATKLPDGSEPAVSEVHVPESNGMSSETVLVDANWLVDGERVVAVLDPPAQRHVVEAPPTAGPPAERAGGRHAERADGVPDPDAADPLDLARVRRAVRHGLHRHKGRRRAPRGQAAASSARSSEAASGREGTSKSPSRAPPSRGSLEPSHYRCCWRLCSNRPLILSNCRSRMVGREARTALTRLAIDEECVCFKRNCDLRP